jgi:hypothetical protein
MKKKLIFILLGLSAIVLAACFYFTPYWAVANMKAAAENRDAEALSEYVDFPSLKESLKANFNAMMESEVSKNMSDNPFGAFGAALASAFINPMIDNLVTPESLAMMMKGEKPDLNRTENSDYKSIPSNKEDNMATSMNYDHFNSFIVTIKEKESPDEPIKMIFKRHGITSWKLSALRLPLPESKSSSVPSKTIAKATKEDVYQPEQDKPEPEQALLLPILSNKRIQSSDFSKGILEDAVWFDVTWDTSRLKRKTRAIKGVLIIGDIFGEPKLRLNWTINEPLEPGKSYVEKGVGFGFNQFASSHKWVQNTDLKDMTFSFAVSEIIYQNDIPRKIKDTITDSSSRIHLTLSNKKFQQSDFSRGIYEDAIWFDINWDTSGLLRKTRAVKGVLVIGDVFGEPQFRLNMTINDPLTPGKSYTQHGVGFDYNQFTGSHKWFRVTDLEDMTFCFEVKDIIYSDEKPLAEQPH